jgi:hypothetical protein
VNLGTFNVRDFGAVGDGVHLDMRRFKRQSTPAFDMEAARLLFRQAHILPGQYS